MSTKRDYAALQQGFGLSRGLSDEFVQACIRNHVPIEAIHRLVTPDGRKTMDEIVLRVRTDWEAELPKLVAQAEGNGGHPYRGTMIDVVPSDIVIVPDLAAVDLTALVRRGVRVGDKELPLTYLDSDYEQWDYHVGLDGKPISGRGKRFAFKIWTPGRNVSSEDVRRYFKNEGGFYGHTAAFTAWRLGCGIMGYHASIPEDNGCWRHRGGRLYVPYSLFDSGHRWLTQDYLDRECHGDWSFVAFREL